MIEKFYVRRNNMSRWDNLLVIYCTREELYHKIAFGAIWYAEDKEGNEIC
jgi:hypothetical protein